MPHKCTNCGRTYEDGSEQLLKGCECGHSLFLYFRKISKEEAEKLGAKEIKATTEENKLDKAKDDIWNVKIEDGVFRIDVASLMAKEPIILAGEEGRYLLSLSSVFGGKKKIVKYPDRVK